MFNPELLLKAIPSVWRDSFQDRDMLETLYGFTGAYLGDAYRGVLEELASTPLEYTPLNRYKTWKAIELSSFDRLYVEANEEYGRSLTIYGLTEVDEILDSCSRIYPKPQETSSIYLEATQDYELVGDNSPIVVELSARTKKSNFFERFSRFIVFLGKDPSLHFPHLEPSSVDIYYPLVFEVSKDTVSALAQQSLYVGKDLTLFYGGETRQAKIAFLKIGDSVITVGLEDSAFSGGIDQETILVSGVAASPIEVKMSSGYTLTRDLLKVWAYDCMVDQFQLYYKYGHLLSTDRHSLIKSTKQYKNLLRLHLKARLRSLSTFTITQLGDVISGSDLIDYNSQVDSVIAVNLVTHRVTTFLTEYALLPKASIDYRVLNTAQNIVTEEGMYPSSSFRELHISDPSSFKLLVQLLGGGNTLTFKFFGDAIEGSIVCSTTRDSLLVYTLSTALTVADVVKVYFSGSKYLQLDVTTLTVTALDSTLALEIDTPLNGVTKIADFNTPGAWWQDVGLYIPESIWTTEYAPRREVSLTQWTCAVGEMPQHRVGDYKFQIPLNTNTKVPETAYLLFEDFLTNKVALISADSIVHSSNLDRVVSACDKLVNLSKKIIPVIECSVVDYIPTPTDTVSIDVYTQVPLSETIPVVGTGGIGALGYTVVVEVDAIVDTSTLATITVGGTDYAVTVLGYQYPMLLLSLGTANYPVAPNDAVTLVGQSAVGTVTHTTNHVGSSSIVMVVGAAYPEYTQYYDFSPDTTIAAHLNVEIS